MLIWWDVFFVAPLRMFHRLWDHTRQSADSGYCPRRKNLRDCQTGRKHGLKKTGWIDYTMKELEIKKKLSLTPGDKTAKRLKCRMFSFIFIYFYFSKLWVPFLWVNHQKDLGSMIIKVFIYLFFLSYFRLLCHNAQVVFTFYDC